MTPGARVAAAIGVLDAWLDGAPVERELTAWARRARYAGSKDRAAVRDHVYDALRRRGSCAALGGPSGRGLMIGALRLNGVEPAEFFTGEGHAPPPLASEEWLPPETGPDDPWRDVPEWLHAVLRSDLGRDADGIVRAMRDRAPLYLRINRGKARREEVEESLVSDGVETRKTVSETALEVIRNPRRLRQSTAYLQGWVEVQDLSVQQACAAVDWPRSGRILDYCAGGGGKTLAIADRSDARLFAHDARPERMADMRVRAERAGISVMPLATTDLPKQAPYDLVLCDVPCSGSGTWRRDPEAKWRLTPERLSDLGRLQREIVAEAAQMVRQGGRLVYMTCSLFEAENDAVLRDTVLADGWHCLQRQLYTPLTASDGFFLAELQHPG